MLLAPGWGLDHLCLVGVWLGVHHERPAKPAAHAQVDSEGAFRYGTSKWFTSALEALKATGVRGMAIDVWVGARCCLHLVCSGCPSIMLRAAANAACYCSMHPRRVCGASTWKGSGACKWSLCMLRASTCSACKWSLCMLRAC